MTWDTRQKRFFSAIVAANALVVLAGIGFTVRGTIKAWEATGTGSLRAVPSLFLTVGFWSCCFVGCWYGCIGLRHWSESRRILKKVSSSDRHAMSVLCRISEANRVVSGSRPLTLILGLIGLFAALLLKEPRWLGFVIMVAGLRWWLWVRITTPPFVLFLSTSDPRSIEIHRQTKLLVSPLHVVTLLDLGNSPSSQVASGLRLDCLRTGNDDDWWKVITILIEMAPLIVINADTSSPGVVREALHLIAEDITFKTVFLTRADARLLDQVTDVAKTASCYVASADTLQGIIEVMLDRAELPKPGRTVGSFASVASNVTNPLANSAGERGGQTTPRSKGKDQLMKQLLLENATCSQCHTSMTIFLGVIRVGLFPRDVYVHESHRGCLRCAACSRYYCWDCSDNRKPCSCGIASWQERQYFPDGVSPEHELRGLL